MLSHQVKEKLKENWPGANDLACFVQCRLYDPASMLEFYVIAMNPEYEDSLAAIVHSENLELELVSLQQLTTAFEAQGQILAYDEHFRPVKAMKLWSDLQRKRRGDYGV